MLRGQFDIPAQKIARHSWDVVLPIEDRPWSIGLIVGPSGCGKTTIATQLWPGAEHKPSWSDRSIIDDMSGTVEQACNVLSSVGFSSPPSWLKPYAVLSNGEKFRADMARTLQSDKDIIVIDEFTSVVDRTIAKIASCAFARSVRRNDRHVVCLSCHYDIIDWLQPDWTYCPADGSFEWRLVQSRPSIRVDIRLGTANDWKYFAQHHYLTSEIHKASRMFVGEVDGRRVVFTSTLPLPHPKIKNCYRGHRTVCHPDYQGIGLGNAISNLIASAYRAMGFSFQSRTTHPAFCRSRAKSLLWRKTCGARFGTKPNPTKMKAWNYDYTRNSMSFKYVGPPMEDAEAAFRLVGKKATHHAQQSPPHRS